MNESQIFIGAAGLWHFFDEEQPQLLYAQLPEYTGKGFAVETGRQVIEYAFAEMYFEYLDASCDAPNLNSQKIAEKLGMKKVREESLTDRPSVFSD